jgi:hypothetical protein
MHDFTAQRDWAAVRLDVELGAMTYNAICRKHRVTRGELLRRIRDNRWSVAERDDLASRRIMIDGLFWALERQIDKLGEGELGNDVSKEAAVLHRLATTLEKLIEIDTASSGRTLNPRESREMTELKTKIAQRLDELGIN